MLFIRTRQGPFMGDWRYCVVYAWKYQRNDKLQEPLMNI